MKIVQAVHGYPPEVVGGTERYVQRISNSLNGRGHDIHVFSGSLKWMEEFSVETENREGVSLTTVHRHDLYFDRWDKAYNPVLEEYFKSYLADIKPDLVHVHHWVRLTSSLCATAACMKIPVVVTLHDLYATCPRFFRIKEDSSYCEAPLAPENCLNCAERWLFQQDQEINSAVASFKADVLSELGCASQILAPSKSHAKIVSERLGKSDLDIRVLPHGQLTELKPAPVSEKGQKMSIVYFSHLYPSKGPKVLLDAFIKMKNRDSTELHFFGDEVFPEFAKELKTLSQGFDVTFHGPYEPKDLETFPMDLVVIPTLLAESYCFILDEAAGLRAPILASNTGAIRERSTGAVMLFEKGDVGALSSALDLFSASPERLEEMRSAPPVKVMTLDEHLDRLEKIYGDVVAKGPPMQINDRSFQHLKEQWDRREYGFKELIRSEQWEALVASLRKRIVELEVELIKRSTPDD